MTKCSNEELEYRLKQEEKHTNFYIKRLHESDRKLDELEDIVNDIIEKESNVTNETYKKLKKKWDEYFKKHYDILEDRLTPVSGKLLRSRPIKLPKRKKH